MAKEIRDFLVVSDVDGTLFQAGYGIPKDNIDAIERFVARGGKFTACTGRSVVALRRYVEWLQFSAPAILKNGAVIYDYSKEEVVFMAELSESVRDVVRDILETFPDVGIELHSIDRITVVHQNEISQNHTAIEHIPFVLADIDSVKGPWTKALILAPNQRILQIKKFVEERQVTDPLYKDFDCAMSSKTMFEIIPKGVNKGTGLLKLAEIMGVEMKNTVAIGDYYNDLEMLETAGYTAAVADAPADIRAKVDFTVRSCLQGGVGELLDSLDSLCDGYVQLKLDI
jgi:Cof subfamily protein (haloacid dehalogenase superfamily)